MISDKKKFLIRKSDEVLEQVAQGGGGIIVHGGVQEKCRYGIEGHGLEQALAWADDWTRRSYWSFQS